MAQSIPGPARLPAMINVIALTQLAFLSLSIVFAKILFRAHVASGAVDYARWVDRHGAWLFLLPLAWIGLALWTRPRRPGSELAPGVQAVGVALAAAAFGFLVSVTLVSWQ